VDQVDGHDDHLGLSGMRERVESMEGRFSLESQLGQGTKIIAWLPYPGEGNIEP
jgi:signal transduction histidine kinase